MRTNMLQNEIILGIKMSFKLNFSISNSHRQSIPTVGTKHFEVALFERNVWYLRNVKMFEV